MVRQDVFSIPRSIEGEQWQIRGHTRDDRVSRLGGILKIAPKLAVKTRPK